ncbi:hypothetical protein QTP88_018772 [Uroleucon formosanum]
MLEFTDEEKLMIFKQCHDSIIGGHVGIHRTIKKIKTQFNWRGLKEDVIEYIKNCESCQKGKVANKNVKQPILITSTSSEPFEKIFLDIVGPLVTTLSGNTYILTLQDDLTKYSMGIALPNHQANTIAEAFVTNFVCTHGIPQTILTDQGTDFLSKIFTEVCKLLQINKINTSPFHPQTNGSLERSHRTLTEYLRHYVDKKLNNWDEYLPYAFFVYNSTEHTSTGYQPYSLLFGRRLEIPIKLSHEPEPRYNYDNYYFDLKQKMQESHKIAKENLIKRKVKSKQIYDNNENSIEIHVKDQILLRDKTQKNKLNPLWIGPYEMALAQTKPYRISRLTQENGMYFENQGPLRLTNSDWKLLIYVKLDNFNQRTKDTMNFYKRTLITCNDLTIAYEGMFKTTCDNFKLTSNSLEREVSRKRFYMLQSIDETDTVSREKRGLVNLVGRVQKTLFGTLDDTDAELYDRQIEKLQSSQQNLLKIIDKQTSVLKATANTFKEANKMEAQINSNGIKFIIVDFEFTMINRKDLLLVSGSISNSLNKYKPVKLEGKPIVLTTTNKLKMLQNREVKKSTVDHLKVQTSNPEAYRTLVHYLRNEKAEFHTFQLKEDKPMRIVIRNLHPSTSTEMIKNELEHRLYEPTDHSKEIFKLESILHTKIKIEEPHKPKIISQCQNCQAYGHTKAYCGYSPRCVRCGDDHSSSACPNSRQDPMRCALCTGALYSPPRHNISNATFTDYFNTIKNNFIIGGDYNAKHNAWGCRTNNPRGIVLYNFVNANNFNVLAPPGPTYWPSSPAKKPDILDIFETKIPSNLHCLTKNILELNSDHSSVILNVSATVFARVEPPRLFSPLTDRLEFQNIINQRIDLKIKLKSIYDIDEAVNNLTMLIQSAAWEATKPNKTHDSKNNYPIVSDQIRCLIVEKRRARAKYQVTRLPSHKTAYNKLANLLKKVLAKYKSYEFEQKLHSLSVIDGSLWRETKRLLKYKTASPHC